MEESFASGKQARKRMNTLDMRWLFILDISIWLPVQREPIGSFGEKWRAGGWLCRAEYLAKTSFEVVLKYFR